MSVYDTTSTLIRPKHTGGCRSSVIQPRIPAPQSGVYSPPHHTICFHRKWALHGTFSVTAKPYSAVEPAFFAISFPLSCLVSIERCVLFMTSIPMYFLAFSIRKLLC